MHIHKFFVSLRLRVFLCEQLISCKCTFNIHRAPFIDIACFFYISGTFMQTFAFVYVLYFLGHSAFTKFVCFVCLCMSVFVSMCILLVLAVILFLVTLLYF